MLVGFFTVDPLVHTYPGLRIRDTDLLAGVRRITEPSSRTVVASFARQTVCFFRGSFSRVVLASWTRNLSYSFRAVVADRTDVRGVESL